MIFESFFSKAEGTGGDHNATPHRTHTQRGVSLCELFFGSDFTEIIQRTSAASMLSVCASSQFSLCAAHRPHPSNALFGQRMHVT
jgi:hypothetical protein